MGIKLSPSSLNVFKNCPRCFWLDKNAKVKQPQGIKASLPNGMDRILKDWFDSLRGTTFSFTDYMKGHGVQAKSCELFKDAELLKKWRNWRTGLSCDVPGLSDVVLGGALDDALEVDGAMAVLDVKTKGKAPDEGYGEKYYQTQMDSYALMLRENGHKIHEKAYLLFYSPRGNLGQAMTGDKYEPIEFDVTLQTLEVHPARAIEIIKAAQDCLAGGVPAPHPNCEYCNHHIALSNIQWGGM